jgi:hypothetical protein
VGTHQPQLLERLRQQRLLRRAHLWPHLPHRQLYPVILDLVRTVWRCRSVVVDATGVGGGLAAFLGAALGPRIVTPYVYTAATKSALAYGLLEATNAGRLQVYAESADPEANAARRELLAQCQAAVYALRANQQMTFNVPESQGHDDHLNSRALVIQAAKVEAHRAAVGHSSSRGERERPFGGPEFTRGRPLPPLRGRQESTSRFGEGNLDWRAGAG